MNPSPVPDLSGQRVLVTRPVHQAEPLCQALQQAGAEAVRFPTLEIQPTGQQEPGYQLLKQQFLNLDLYRAVIFVSANAARLGHDWIDQYWPQLPVGIDWLAVGSATARTLGQLAIDANAGQGNMDSEALLQLPQLQQLDGAKVLICRGHGGRELLAEQLRQRGAQVDYAELYHRQRPAYSPEEIKSIIYKSGISAMFVSSGEALSNLLSLVESISGQAQPMPNPLAEVPLVVPSQRVAQLAEQQHFKQILVAANATDSAMIKALHQWSRNQSQ